jgi:hypothetical protein
LAILVLAGEQVLQNQARKLAISKPTIFPEKSSAMARVMCRIKNDRLDF